MTIEMQQHTDQELEVFLETVTSRIQRTLGETCMRPLLHEAKSLTSMGGKLLRSRLAYRVGRETGADLKVLEYGAAAVEMIHTASLLHDDVIDGGTLRRGMPTFWVEKGRAGAILLGDLFLFKAIELMCRVADGRYTHELVKLTGEVCEAESEQELLLNGSDSKLEVCTSIARRKTGALFAFTSMIAGGDDPIRTAALKEAGYLVGTAYQLADDLLDVVGDAAAAGKTLGTDAERQIVSAARLEGVDLVGHLDHLQQQAIVVLNGDREAVSGIRTYVEQDIGPAIASLIGG